MKKTLPLTVLLAAVLFCFSLFNPFINPERSKTNHKSSSDEFISSLIEFNNSYSGYANLSDYYVLGVTISASQTSNICSGNSVAFSSTVTGLTEGNTLTYSWNFGDGESSTQANPNHSFHPDFGCGNSSYNVSLTIQELDPDDNVVSTVTSNTVNMSIKKRPVVSLVDTAQPDPEAAFRNCDNIDPDSPNPIYTVEVNLGSDVSSCITSYTLNWGEGANITNLQPGDFPLSHTYTALDAYALTITAIADNGCNRTRTYTVANQANPAGSLGTLGATTGLCVGAVVPFTIDNWDLNSPGTQYIIDYGDGIVETYDHPLNSTGGQHTINHTYNTTSCPESTEFLATLDVVNACDTTPFSAGNIKIRISPEASFTSPDSACLNQSVAFTNTSDTGYTGSSCSTFATYTWDFGDPGSGSNNEVVTTGASPSNVSHTFSQPGNYTVTLTASNTTCGAGTPYTRQICIEGDIPNAAFTLNNTEGCETLNAQATNTTNINADCTTSYNWSVNYVQDYCGSAPANNYNYFTNSTSASSENPSFHFPNPGKYEVTLTVSNSCNTKSATQVVHVKQPPTAAINTIPDVCGGTSATISPTAVVTNCGTSTPTYLWSFPGGSPSTSTSATPTNITYASAGTYTVSLQITNECGSNTTTKSFTVTPEVIANAGTDQTICNGSTTLSGSASGGAGTVFTYSWSPATGLNNPNIANPTASPTSTTTYTLTTNSGSCFDTDEVTVFVNNINPGTITSDQTICSGDDIAQLNQGSAASAAGTITYQWESSTASASSGYSNISGATGTTYDPGSATQNTWYRRKATSTLNGVTCTETSNTVAITINTVTPGSIGQDQVICSGGNPLAFTQTSAATGNGTLSYQWQSSTTSAASGFTNISGATSITYDPPTLTQNTWFKRIDKSVLNGITCTAETNVVTVSLTSPPSITAQPVATQTLCEGATPDNLTVTASGSSMLLYQWYSNTANNTSSGTAINGATQASFTPPTLTTGTTYYYCIVSMSEAGCNTTSAVAAVEVIAAPIFTQQPQSQTICNGQSLNTLNVSFQNGASTPTYQWYNNTANNNTGGSAISGATTSSYSPPNTTGTNYYYVVLTFPSGGCSTLSSDVASITVTPLPEVTNALAPVICSQDTFDATPSDGGGNTLPSGTLYTWTAPTGSGFSGGSAQNTATAVVSQTLTNTTNATVTANYTVTPIANGCNGTPFTVTVTINPKPNVTNQTEIICSEESFTLAPTNGSGNTVPSNTTYSWNSPSVTGGITGGTSGNNATAITVSLNNPTNTNQTATYTITPSWTNGFETCTGNSFTYTVTVEPKPAITNKNITICSGETFTYTPANGTDGIVPSGTQYNWSAPGTVTGITGLAAGNNATTISGTLNNTSTTAQTVTYTVTPVSGSCTGSDFTVTVTVNPMPVVNPIADITVCNGETIPTIDFSGDVAGTVFNWVNTTPSIGISGSGTNDISSFSGNNSGTNAVTATITVTPTANGCSGTPQTFTITVNPAPLAQFSIPNQTICSGDTSAAVNVTSATTGATINWTATIPADISGATASGTTSIPVQTLVNNSNNPLDVTYTATASTSGGTSCPGASATYTITIMPIPYAEAQTEIICSEETLAFVPSNGGANYIPSGTTFTWSAPTGSGFSGGSAQNTPQTALNQTLTNTTNAPVTATYSVTPIANGCNGTPFSVVVTINPKPAIQNASAAICSEESFTLSPTNGSGNIVPSNTTYSWNTPTVTGGITGGTSGNSATNITGTLTNPTNTNQTATYTITPSWTNGSETCVGNPFTYIVTVEPKPAITNKSITICSGDTFTITPTNNTDGIVPAGTQYTWAAPSGTNVTGLTAGTNAANVSGTLTNNGTTTTTVTYVVTPVAGNCTGSDFTIDVTINPLPIVNPISNITVCNGDNIATIDFQGAVPNTIFNWVNDTPSIGLAGSGADDISGFNGSNNGDNPVIATITVTPEVNGCYGASETFTITVNPAPLAQFSIPDQTICSGETSAVVSLTSATSGASISWTATVPADISGATTSGTTSIPAQTLVNNSTSPLDVTFEAVATTSGTTSCPGALATYTITVMPIPYAEAQSDIICSEETLNFIPANGGANYIPTGTTFIWAAPTGSGFSGGSAQNTPQSALNQSLTNTTNAPVTATYSVTPIANGCDGIPFNVTVTINPKPTIQNSTLDTCSEEGFTFTPTNGSGAIVPNNTTYSWSAPLVTGGITGGTSGTASTDINGLLTNPTNINQTATYTVTPSWTNGTETCIGNDFTVTVTVEPKPAITNQSITICSGDTFTISPANSTDGIVPAGTQYTWAAPAPVTDIVGLASGTNSNEVSGTLTNNGTTPATITYTVTPVTGNCTGADFTVEVTVNPLPVVDALPNLTVCNGDAIATIDFTGDVPGTVFNWVNNTPSIGLATSGTDDIAGFNGLNSGTDPVTATITVTPSVGTCVGSSETFTITVNPAPLAEFSIPDQTICSGQTSAPVTLSTATPNATINWTATIPSGINGADATGTTSIDAQTLTNTTTAPLDVTYSAIATTSGTAACPGAAAVYTITVMPIPYANDVPQLVMCSEETLNFVPTNGGTNYIPSGTTFTWTAPTGAGISGGSTQTTPQNSLNETLVNTTNAPVTATYIVTPIANGCDGIPFDVTITVNPKPFIQDITLTTCSDEGFTHIPVNGSGNIVPANTTYSWSEPVVTGGLTGGATGTDSADINGLLTNPTNIDQTATYTVTPSWTNGTETCIGNDFTITVTIEPKPAINNHTVTICSGDTFTYTPMNGTDGIVPSGIQYTWSAPAPVTNITGLAAGNNVSSVSGTLGNNGTNPETITYTVTPVADNCTGADFTVAVTVNPLPVVDPIADIIVCNGDVIPTIDFTGDVPGTIFSWVNNTPSINLAASGTDDISTFSATNSSTVPVTATIVVTPSVGPCVGPSETFTITVNPAPETQFSIADQTICSGTSSSPVSLSSTTPNTVITWTVNVPAGITGATTSGGNSIPAQTLVNNTSMDLAVTYTAIATTSDATSCPGAPAVYTIHVTPVPYVNDPATAVACSDEPINFIPVNGGNNNVPTGTLFTWLAPVGNGYVGGSVENTPQPSLNHSLTNVTDQPITVTYTVTPQYGGCIGIPFDVEVTINPAAYIPNQTISACSGEAFTFDPGPVANVFPAGTTFTYAAPTGNPTGGTPGTDVPVISGTLTNSGTSAQNAVYIVTPTSPTGSCVGPDFTLTVSVNPVFDVSAVVSDFNGFEISYAGAMDGWINLNPTGGSGNYNYSWTGPDGFTSTDQNLTNLGPGEYQVHVNDGYCNDIVLDFVMVEPLPLIIEEVIPSHTNVLCHGEHTGIIEVGIVQVSIAPFDYALLLQDGTVYEQTLNSFAENYVFDNLPAGVYDIRVIDANGSDKYVEDVVITEPDTPLEITDTEVTDFNGFSISCNGAQDAYIDITVAGGYPGYTYNWTGPNGFTATTQDISNLNPGTYTVVVMDTTNYCQVNQTFIITEPDVVAFTGSIFDYNGYGVSCFGATDGMIDLSPTGGTGTYTFVWTGPDGFTAATEDLDNLAAGIYEVYIFDTNTCTTATQTFDVTEPPGMNISETHEDILCFGYATGMIDITVTGGTPLPGGGYNYDWNGPGTFSSSAEDLTFIPAGTYDVVATDANGCSIDISVTITQQPQIFVQSTITPITCYGADDATVTLNITGGNAPYTVEWDNFGFGTYMDNLGAGDYGITITDSFGCVKGIIITVEQAPIFTIQPIVEQISCNGANDASIDLNLIGGVAPLTLEWADGSNSGLVRNNLGPGTYTVTITDATPCVIIESFTFVEPAPLAMSAVVEDALDCYDTQSGSIDLLIGGGTPPYTYAWSNGATTEDLATATNGNYFVEVTDSRGCTISDTFTVNRPDPLVINVTDDEVVDCEDGSIIHNYLASAIGGIPPYTYTWSSGTITGSNNNQMSTDIPHGTVLVSVTDSYGCTVTKSFEVDTHEIGEANFSPTSFSFETQEEFGIFDPVTFENLSTGDFLTVAWNFGDGNYSTAVSPIHSYGTPGTYTVTLTVDYYYGCSSTFEQTIVVTKGYRVMIPDGFTPNNDGYNDFFVPKHKGLKTIELKVFDTWGALLYEESGVSIKGWNGSLTDLDAENGNYYYRIKGETYYGESVNFEGSFTLLK